jgi:hypothetical protein
MAIARDATKTADTSMRSVLTRTAIRSRNSLVLIIEHACRETHAFALLCGYSMGNFYKDAAQKDICQHHTHIVSDFGDAAVA